MGTGDPASKGFLLAGGAALLAQHLTARPTEDLDFFTAPDRGHVPAARDALEGAARQRGWSTERIHDSDTFCRLIIRSAGSGAMVSSSNSQDGCGAADYLEGDRTRLISGGLMTLEVNESPCGSPGREVKDLGDECPVVGFGPDLTITASSFAEKWQAAHTRHDRPSPVTRQAVRRSGRCRA
jgi:hypothetical protein